MTSASLETPSSQTDRPFVIYTLQRTGGTNLTKHLNLRSSFRIAKQHEPFNQPRIYGHVTIAWQETGDLDALQSEMRAICAKNENMKHCVEMVPGKITKTLIEAASEQGYRHLFLYRDNAAARILSMEYAQRTKVWGPNHVEKVAQDAKAFAKPLDVDALVSCERRCVRLLNRFWEQLKSSGETPTALAYEELYGADAGVAQDALFRILAYLGLSRGPDQDLAMLEELRGEGDQNTRDRYDHFKGADALRSEVGRIPKLAFSRQAV